MDLNVTHDENGVPHLDRLEFTKTLIDSLKKYLDGEIFKVSAVNSTSVTVAYEDGTTDTFSISEDMDPELRLLVYVAYGSTILSTPTLLFHLTDEDNDGDLDITGISLSDFSGVVLGTDDADFVFTLSLGARYLKNLFRLKGIMSFSSTSEAQPKSLALEGAKMEDAEAHVLAELLAGISKNEDVKTISDLRQRAILRPKRIKKLKMDRAKNPALARARSMRARLNWRRNKMALLKGIRKFHNSARGKRLHKLMGQFRATQK